jgi:hypothetical protein
MMAKRRTIGTNPLDAVIPTPREEKSPSRVVKERLTVHLPVDLIDRIKNAVYWTPGLTLAGLAEEALAAAVEKLERARGEPFPPRRSELKGGRPLK